jgi:Tfp pilus assembly protein PilN
VSARDGVVVGGFPRVSLLPPSVVEEARERSVTRRFAFAVVGVLVVAGLGVLATTWLATQARAELAAAQQETATLTAEQARYRESEELAGLLATLEDARAYATSTEIDWTAYIAKVSATMPAGTRLDEVSVSASAPWETPLAPSGPLRGDVAGTLKLRVTSSTEAELTTWVRSLETLPGYADSSLDDRTADTGSESESGTVEYTASVTLNLGESARAARFTPSAPVVAVTPPDADAASPADAASTSDGASTPDGASLDADASPSQESE